MAAVLTGKQSAAGASVCHACLMIRTAWDAKRDLQASAPRVTQSGSPEGWGLGIWSAVVTSALSDSYQVVLRNIRKSWSLVDATTHIFAESDPTLWSSVWGVWILRPAWDSLCYLQVWAAALLPVPAQECSCDLHCGWSSGQVWPGFWENEHIHSETRAS